LNISFFLLRPLRIGQTLRPQSFFRPPSASNAVSKSAAVSAAQPHCGGFDKLNDRAQSFVRGNAGFYGQTNEKHSFIRKKGWFYGQSFYLCVFRII
jgi:hypothetical protein